MDTHDLWVYGSGRSCRVRGESCAFFIGHAQVALGLSVSDLSAAASRWLLAKVPVAALPQLGVEVEPHAEVLEADPARWHWLHVRDRISDPKDVLAPLAPLIRALADNPVANRFFPYSSLYQLCFSASSHYPWVGAYPIVCPTAETGVYMVGRRPCSLSEAVERIESALRASPVAPFFGSAPTVHASAAASILTREGSTLEPRLVQRGAWPRLELSAGDLLCEVSDHALTCVAGRDQRSFECRSLEDAIGLARAFLEQGASLAAIDSDSRVVRRPLGEIRLPETE